MPTSALAIACWGAFLSMFTLFALCAFLLWKAARIVESIIRGSCR